MVIAVFSHDGKDDHFFQMRGVVHEGAEDEGAKIFIGVDIPQVVERQHAAVLLIQVLDQGLAIELDQIGLPGCVVIQAIDDLAALLEMNA